jgi:hypothetical protein
MHRVDAMHLAPTLFADMLLLSSADEAVRPAGSNNNRTSIIPGLAYFIFGF